MGCPIHTQKQVASLQLFLSTILTFEELVGCVLELLCPLSQFLPLTFLHTFRVHRWHTVATEPRSAISRYAIEASPRGWCARDAETTPIHTEINSLYTRCQASYIYRLVMIKFSSVICRVPLYTVFTLTPTQPPITKISVDDKTAIAVAVRGAGRSLM